MAPGKKPRNIHRRLKGFPRRFFDNSFERVRPGLLERPLPVAAEASHASNHVNFGDEAQIYSYQESTPAAASSNYIEPNVDHAQIRPSQSLLPYSYFTPVPSEHFPTVGIYPPISDNGTQYYCQWQPETNNLLVDAYYEDNSSAYNDGGSGAADTDDLQNNFQWDAYQSRLVDINDSPANFFAHGYNSPGIYTPHPSTVSYLSAPVAPTIEEVRAFILQSTPPPGFQGNWVEVPIIPNYDHAEISVDEVAEGGRNADPFYFAPNAVDENPHT